jgi:CRISPR-associated protein Csx17
VPEPQRLDLELAGCTPEPLMAYLKALGILRLVSEQKDADARGWWKNDVFWLRSTLTVEAMQRFFLEEYRPTPVVAPWAGGSGFFEKDNTTAVKELGKSQAPRIAPYVEVIRTVEAILKEENVGKKPKDKDKVRLIRRYRCTLPDAVVSWMDAALALQQDGQRFAPLLGTGGNDGRLDFTQNFMQRIVSLRLHKTDPADDRSHAWIEQALFANRARLDQASVGQFAPGRAGGPNATQGMEGESTDNPWEFVLMIEGAILFAGAAMRRYGLAESLVAAFPFTVRAVAAGFDSRAPKDEAEARGELWLPLWTRKTSIGELRQLFGEGRAEVCDRNARDGTDFARAVAGLGVDRGITAFGRFAFLRRSGKAFLAAPLGRLDVVKRYGTDLLRETDSWLGHFREAAGDKNAPPGFGSALRRIDSAIFDYCKYGGAAAFQRIIVALGVAEREMVRSERFRELKKLRPLAGLSEAWLEAADDNSPEFAIAQSLVSLHDLEQKVGPLRANVEPVNWNENCRSWAEKNRYVVWTSADLVTNLANVLARRMMDGVREGCRHLPLASGFAVSLNAIAMFLDGDLDDDCIEQLVWALMLINVRRYPIPSRQGTVLSISGAVRYEGAHSTRPLSRGYALLKLLFLPRPLIPDQNGERTRWRVARDGEPGIAICPEPHISALLRAGRIGEACKIAAERLRVSGLPVIPGPIPGRPIGMMRDDIWSECSISVPKAQRLAAALLIPISSKSVNDLVHLVCRADTSAAFEALAYVTEGESE